MKIQIFIQESQTRLNFEIESNTNMDNILLYLFQAGLIKQRNSNHFVNSQFNRAEPCGFFINGKCINNRKEKLSSYINEQHNCFVFLRGTDYQLKLQEMQQTRKSPPTVDFRGIDSEKVFKSNFFFDGSNLKTTDRYTEMQSPQQSKPLLRYKSVRILKDTQLPRKTTEFQSLDFRTSIKINRIDARNSDHFKPNRKSMKFTSILLKNKRPFQVAELVGQDSIKVELDYNSYKSNLHLMNYQGKTVSELKQFLMDRIKLKLEFINIFIQQKDVNDDDMLEKPKRIVVIYNKRKVFSFSITVRFRDYGMDFEDYFPLDRESIVEKLQNQYYLDRKFELEINGLNIFVHDDTEMSYKYSFKVKTSSVIVFHTQQDPLSFLQDFYSTDAIMKFDDMFQFTQY